MSLYSVLVKIAKPILYPFMPWKVHGIENIPQSGPVVLCANHISMTDPVLMALNVHRQIFFIAKKEVCDVPILGGILRALGVFAVDRAGKDIKAVRKCLSVLKSSNILGIFPEGTRVINGKVSSAKPGVALIAKKSNAPLVTVHIKNKAGKFKLFRKTEIFIGKPVSYSDLCGDLDYQQAADKIMETIYKLGE